MNEQVNLDSYEQRGIEHDTGVICTLMKMISASRSAERLRSDWYEEWRRHDVRGCLSGDVPVLRPHEASSEVPSAN